MRTWTRLALGSAPLAFVGWSFGLYISEGRAGDCLWICNIANVLLGLSILTAWAPGIWAGALWILLGTPLWLLDAVSKSGFEFHSYFTHLGSGLIGLIACRAYRPRRGAWWVAFSLLAFAQALARLATDPAKNVNVAFAPYVPGLSYPAYWTLSALLIAAALWASERLLRRVL